MAASWSRRDADGHVITEAYASGQRLAETVASLRAHVPLLGRLLVMAPADALARRVSVFSQGATASGPDGL